MEIKSVHDCSVRLDVSETEKFIRKAFSIPDNAYAVSMKFENNHILCVNYRIPVNLENVNVVIKK